MVVDWPLPEDWTIDEAVRLAGCLRVRADARPLTEDPATRQEQARMASAAARLLRAAAMAARASRDS